MTQIVLVLASGAVQTVITVAVLKNDNAWLKDQIKGLAEWIIRVEKKVDEARAIK